MKKTALGLIFAVASFAAAAENRFHPNHLFIKMKAGQSLVKSSKILSSKNIIGNIYLVQTNDVNGLASEVSASNAVEYTQKDFYSGKSVMPKHEVLEPVQAQIKALADFFSFNDPEVNKLWAFNSTAGMNVADAYAALPAHN